MAFCKLLPSYSVEKTQVVNRRTCELGDVLLDDTRIPPVFVRDGPIFEKMGLAIVVIAVGPETRAKRLG